MTLNPGECIICTPEQGATINCPGAIVSVVIPNKWIGFIHPDHPAYIDMLNVSLRHMDIKQLKDFHAIVPHVAQQYTKMELNRRGVKL